MKLKQWRDAVTLETHLEWVISDSDLARVNLDPMDRMVLNSPHSKETPIADALQNAQLLAFRIEQQTQPEGEVR